MTMPYRPIGALCDACGAPVKPDEAYSWREVIAIEMVGRNGRPTSRLRHRRYTGRILCPPCGMDERNQGSLFDE